jgi:hypothetical protein
VEALDGHVLVGGVVGLVVVGVGGDEGGQAERPGPDRVRRPADPNTSKESASPLIAIGN